MYRGTVLVFNTDDEKFNDWKYYRVIDAITKENKTDSEVDEQIGARMFFVGNVLKDNGEVLSRKEIFMEDFFKLAQEKEARVAADADTALIFLTNAKF